MARKRRASTWIFFALTALVFIGGIIFWVSDLTSDPPMYYSGLGQSLATDPHQYVFHARNKILYGEADPYDYPRWTVYEHSLTSLTALIWFSLTEVSLKNANLVGVMLSLGGLLFLLLGLARHHRPWVPAAVAFAYIINSTLITYGRLPYLENGLIFISSIVFFVYSWWGDRIWGVTVSGILIALATFAGKLFGVLMLPALLASIALCAGRTRGRRALAAGASFLVAGLAFILISYVKEITAAFAYASEQTYGIKGYPAGLTSPWSYLEYLVTYWYRTLLFHRNPDLVMFIFSSGFLLIVVFGARERRRQLSRSTVFSLLWLGFALGGLAPHEYSPVRYSLLLIPPILVSCFAVWDEALRQRTIELLIPGRVATVLLMALVWYSIYPVIGNLFYFNADPGRWLVWAVLPAGVILGLAIRVILMRWRPMLTRRIGMVILVGILLLSAIANSLRYWKLDIKEHNFNIREASEDVRHILGAGAVLSGPYAPALTIDNTVRPFVYLFGVAEVDSTLFDRYPITHIAVDQSNLDAAIHAYPQIENGIVIARYWIRDYEVMLIRVNDLFANERANAYNASGYEQAVQFARGDQVDSSMDMIKEHLTRHPMTKSVGKLMAEILLAQNRYEQAVLAWQQLAELYPTDFHIQMRAGEVILSLGLANSNQGLISDAYRLFERGAEANPYKASLANQAVENLLNQYRR